VIAKNLTRTFSTCKLPLMLLNLYIQMMVTVELIVLKSPKKQRIP